MRKFLLIFAVMALVLTVSAPAAFAAIHPIAESECAAQDSQGGGGQHQNPPGQIDNSSTDEGMPNDGQKHPWQNANDNAKNGQGSDHCTNKGHEHPDG